MPALHVLGLAFAVACLAGVNLYLTMFLAGLAGRIGWMPMHGDLAVIGDLAHPAVMTVAALLYLLQAIVDKVPAMDSLWDALHTVIRPAGAVVLALHIMGNADPAYLALAGVLAGAAGLTTHLAKSAGRLLVNNSPGPMLNIFVSIGEDVLVLGIFALTVYSRMAGLVVCLTLTVLLWLLFPRMFRVGRASLFFMWKKLRLPAGGREEKMKLPARVSAEQDMLIHSELPGPCTAGWAVRCVTGRIRKFRKLRPNTFGTLVSVREHPGVLIFMGRRWFHHRSAALLLSGCETKHESGFLSEDLVVYNKAERQHVVFRFTRAEEALAARLEEELRGRKQPARSGAGPERLSVEDEIEPPRFIAESEVPPLIMESPVPFQSPAAVDMPRFFPISPFPASTDDAFAPSPSPPAPPAPPATIAGVPPMPALSAAAEGIR